MIKVFVIGTGNLGTHLCKALESHGAGTCVLVGYRNNSNSTVPGINAPLYNQNIPDCDLIILAVPDDAVVNISDQLDHCAVIAHTSGSVSMDALKKHKKHGVFYLPQTFSKSRNVNFSEVTICLEANSEDCMMLLKKVGSTLSRKQTSINSQQRKQLHLAAVFMNNFVNHCYFKSNSLMSQAALDKQILEPLMKETLEKAIAMGAVHAQTGPARRGDDDTLNSHLELLEQTDRDMYIAISQSIKNAYEDKL